MTLLTDAIAVLAPWRAALALVPRPKPTETPIKIIDAATVAALLKEKNT